MSSTSSSTVSAGQDLRLIGPDNLTVPITADLRYSREDPYAITMALAADGAEPVVWTFGRELLATALRRPEGIGDVRAWPAGKKTLILELGPRDGYARLEASAAGIGAFLARTYELVPAGQETAFLSLDAELTELLDQA